MKHMERLMLTVNIALRSITVLNHHIKCQTRRSASRVIMVGQYYNYHRWTKWQLVPIYTIYDEKISEKSLHRPLQCVPHYNNCTLLLQSDGQKYFTLPTVDLISIHYISKIVELIWNMSRQSNVLTSRKRSYPLFRRKSCFFNASSCGHYFCITFTTSQTHFAYFSWQERYLKWQEA